MKAVQPEMMRLKELHKDDSKITTRNDGFIYRRKN